VVEVFLSKNNWCTAVLYKAEGHNADSWN
jgi:hypothetical protein